MRQRVREQEDQDGSFLGDLDGHGRACGRWVGEREDVGVWAAVKGGIAMAMERKIWIKRTASSYQSL